MRAVPASYVDATRGAMEADTGPIDIALALAQHRDVAEGLSWLGFDVEVLPADEAHPDSIFVEDPAVVVEGRALLARSAHPVRAGEAAAIERALRALGLGVRPMAAPATLDGGDVLDTGDRLLVSRSGRTNAAGIEALAAAFPERRVVEVPLPPGTLHLKCACSALDPGTLVAAVGALPAAAVEGLRVLEIPRAEGYAANAVGVAGRALIAAGFPGTAEVVRSAGYEVRAVGLSEIRKGDGSLTCLSLRGL